MCCSVHMEITYKRGFESSMLRLDLPCVMDSCYPLSRTLKWLRNITLSFFAYISRALCFMYVSERADNSEYRPVWSHVCNDTNVCQRYSLIFLIYNLQYSMGIILSQVSFRPKFAKIRSIACGADKWSFKIDCTVQPPRIHVVIV